MKAFTKRLFEYTTVYPRFFNFKSANFFWKFKSAAKTQVDEKPTNLTKSIVKKPENRKSSLNSSNEIITDRKILMERRKVKNLNTIYEVNLAKTEYISIYKFFLTSNNLSWQRFSEFQKLISSVPEGFLGLEVNSEICKKLICCLNTGEYMKFNFSNEEQDAIAEVIGTTKDTLNKVILSYCNFRAIQQVIRNLVIINQRNLPFKPNDLFDSPQFRKTAECEYLVKTMQDVRMNRLNFTIEDYTNYMKTREVDKKLTCRNFISQMKMTNYS